MISVLICDDSLVARKQVAKSLPDDWPVSVHFAKHGEEAMVALAEGKGQLLLLDLNMPVMDGYEVLAAIKDKGIKTKVVVISGDIQPEAHKRVSELGAIAFIEKPINKEVLGGELEKHGLKTEVWLDEDEVDDLDPEIRDVYQEISNVAMGQAGAAMAKMLGVFVELPIPRVNLLANTEIHMALDSIEGRESVSAVSQGFTGPGISGEALVIFHDSSFADVAKLMKFSGNLDDHVQLELLMDAANVMVGTYLNCLAEQLDVHFSQGHPAVLGQHQSITEMIKTNQKRWRKTLTIEISYSIENHFIQCDLLLLFTDDSMEMMNKKLHHLMED